MLYNLTAVRDNIRNREGKRVFYLGKVDLNGVCIILCPPE